MSKLDQFLQRFFAIGLIALLALAVLVIVVPHLMPSTSLQEPTAVGERETLVGRVAEVLEEGSIDLGDDMTHPYQRLLVHIERGSLAGEEIVIEEGTVNIVSEDRLFERGDRVYVERVIGQQQDRFYISDPMRTSPLMLIVGLFFSLVALIGRGKGLRAILGTVFSLIVIFAFIVPQILDGRDPVTVSVIGSIVLMAVSTYLVYGWNPKAHAAVLGMMLSLVLTGVIAWLFVGWTRLTGLSAEESSYLVMELGGDVNLRGLVLGGMIIGSLGVLDDVCVGQASAVFELVNANRDLEWRQLFRSSLNIGRDHIAAMVNTLLLAYVGASLPLMLVFTIYQEPIMRRINREPIAEEVVRTLVGSVGLVLAVPITGLLASLLARWVVRRERAARSS
ncbi:MAG: YibE/F family protein [Anaerolineae bacterium]|jgi:uncharacterized membrane protein